VTATITGAVVLDQVPTAAELGGIAMVAAAVALARGRTARAPDQLEAGG